MNNSVSDPSVSDPWKRLKIQYVSLACGLALAAAVSLGGVSFGRVGDSHPTARAVASRIEPTRHEQPETVFYLVSSRAGAARAQAFEDEAEWSTPDQRYLSTHRNVVILLAETAAEQASARRVADGQRATIEELGGQVTIVDWLGR